MAEEDPRFRNAQTYVAPAGAYVAPSNTYVTPNGAPVTPPPPAPPPQPSMRARALAEILSQERYEAASSGENEGDPSTIRPKFFANMNAVNTDRYGGDYTPSERFNREVRPEDNDGEYLYNLMHKLGPGVASGFATGGSPGDSDEDMMARNMTKFMRNYQNYVPKDDLALALAEIYGTDPGAAPGQTGSRGQPGQADKAGSVGGANTTNADGTPATLGSMAGGFKNLAGMPTGTLGFGYGLLNAMRFGSPFRTTAYSPYPEMDQYGNAIPGTELAINTETWGDDTSGPPGYGGPAQSTSIGPGQDW